jgi:predicted dithiol-disulfide oxidoreductase (DUF899 family)
MALPADQLSRVPPPEDPHHVLVESPATDGQADAPEPGDLHAARRLTDAVADRAESAGLRARYKSRSPDAGNAKAPLPRILAFADERGWRRLRLLSSARTTYNRDYFAETAEGHQRPMLNVFHRDGETIRHFWGSELFYAPTEPGQDLRHVGTIEPLWNLYDLTPAGRGTDWDEQLSY